MSDGTKINRQRTARRRDGVLIMKIYEVKPDISYRFMYPEDSLYESEEWEFNGKPLIGVLPNAFKAYFDKGKDEPFPDIAYIGMMTFAFRKDVATELADILEAAGELLAFYVDDDLWYCLNVTTIANAVDEEKSTYKINDGSTKLGLTKPFFDVEKIPNASSLFKIPNDNFTTIYCADRRGGDEDVMNNFFCAVAGHHYTGVEFLEVYDSED